MLRLIGKLTASARFYDEGAYAVGVGVYVPEGTLVSYVILESMTPRDLSSISDVRVVKAPELRRMHLSDGMIRQLSALEQLADVVE